MAQREIDWSTINLYYVDDLESAAKFLEWLDRPRSIIAIDTENRGLDWFMDRESFGRIIQFGDDTTGWTLSLERWRGLCMTAMQKVVAAQTPCVFWNAKYDMHTLEGAGLAIPNWTLVHDGYIMDHLIYPIRWHTLKGVSKLYYGQEAGVGADMLAQHFSDYKVFWDTVSLDAPVYTTYAALDTVLTCKLALDHGAEIVRRNLLPAYEREMATIATLYRTESRGLRVNTEYAKSLKAVWEDDIIRLRLQAEAWGVANPGSKADVVAALQTTADWDPEEFTKTGEPKLDVKILKALDLPIADLVIEYKRKVKWSKTYLKTFIEMQDDDGYCHPSINTMAARTGRMSIQRPALQTLPSKEASIRHCILPPEGMWLWACDYDAMELRAMAHYSEDPGLLQMFRDGLDPHSYTASMVYGLPYDEVASGLHKEKRGLAKNTVFARIYGAGADTIAKTAGVPVAEVKAFIQMYDVRFPGVDRFSKSVESEAKLHQIACNEPYVESAYGRWLNVEPNQMYALVNYLIQGSCADMVKEKIVDLDAAGYGDNIYLVVHDEILFVFPEGDTEGPEECRQIMEEHNKFLIPFTCGIEGPFNSWGQSYE